MQKFVFLFLGIAMLLFSTTVIYAQTQPQQPSLLNAPLEEITDLGNDENASDSSEATPEAALASPSAAAVKKVQEKQDQDITNPDPNSPQTGKLAAYLQENPPGPLSWNNFLEYGIRQAITDGVPPSILVLVLLFPLIASLIGASRHIIGLRGFGIYIPAVLSVALVSTGIGTGFIIFIAIVFVAATGKRFLARFSMPYLPRTAILLWIISIGILALFLLAPIFNITSLVIANIFPILILVLLAENFLDAQSRTKQSDAIGLTLETLALAIISSMLLKWEFLQKIALLEPELLLTSVVVLNILVAKFSGLRLSEQLRFRSIIEEE